MNHSQKRAVIYARVSTDQQQHEQQLLEMKAFVLARGWIVVAEVVDHGWSGATDNRPGIQKVFKMAKSREFDCLVVVKMDRFFRSISGIVNSIRLLDSLGIKLISLRDQFDMTTPDGKLLLNIICLFSEFELDLVKSRTRAGLEYAKRCGKRLGRPPLSNQVNEKIIELRTAGKTYYEIHKELKVSKGAISRAIAGSPKTGSPQEASSNLITSNKGDN